MRHLLTITLILLGTIAAFAQTTTNNAASQSNTTIPNQSGQTINLEADTQLAAQLQNTLDVRKAKVGDQIVLKTTEAIKSNGQTLVKKGARLIGRVTVVQQGTKGGGESSIGLVLDRLESGTLVVPITATIISIAPPKPQTTSIGDEDIPTASGGTRGGAIARSQRPRVVNTNSGSGMVGGGVGTDDNVLDTTAGGVGASGRTIGAIRISQSTDADSAGSTTLSLTGDKLRLEKGSTFRLTVNQTTAAAAAAAVGGNL